MDEMCHVPRRRKLMHRGRQQPALIDIPRATHLSHGTRESLPKPAAKEIT
jgi:hypothetical protein